MTNLIDQIDAASLRDDVPDFRAGDTLKVHVKVVRATVPVPRCSRAS